MKWFVPFYFYLNNSKHAAHTRDIWAHYEYVKKLPRYSQGLDIGVNISGRKSGKALEKKQEKWVSARVQIYDERQLCQHTWAYHRWDFAE